ncbi:MAG: CBS domain-containing protein [Alphaproteobacteria bacterium]|nr:CBS domain-containing protein [Alphaproteobacteria bacterium]
MSLKSIMIQKEDVISVTPDMTVKDALAKLVTSGVRSMPVIDSGGKYLGLFNFRALVGKLLPASACVEGGVASLSFMAEDIAFIIDKFEQAKAMTVAEIMRTDVPAIHMDTVFEEALLQIYSSDAPLPVLEPETGTLVGLFSKQCAIAHFMARASAGKGE